MHFVQKISVRAQITIAILLIIVLSWVISTGLANYFNYLAIRSIHNEMLRNADIYPAPIPEPRFGIYEFFFGFYKPAGPPPQMRPPRPLAGAPALRPMPGIQGRFQGPPPPPPPHPPDTFPDTLVRNNVIARALAALALAVIAGAWLSRRFTNPLSALTKGAMAYHAGKFDYRIPADGEDEFSTVAGAMNKMADRVSRQIGSLEEDAARRRQFLADVAHELRSPVTTLKTMADALQDGLAEDPERKQRAISSLARTSERLLRLVVDLMELAKLDLKELPLNKRSVDLRELVNASIQSHEEQASANCIAIHDLEDGNPIMMKLDPDRITQVLDNLLQNAIAYAGKDSTVQVAVQNGNPVKIIVSDNGAGIPSKDLPCIFDPFYRVDSARTPDESHSGLGLRISKGLIEMHGGSLVLTSSEDKGTSAEISLPRDLH